MKKKTKAKTNKAEIDENNSKACNCGKCAECKKRKTKEKNPKEEGENKKEEKITISKKNKDISEKNKFVPLFFKPIIFLNIIRISCCKFVGTLKGTPSIV